MNSVECCVCYEETELITNECSHTICFDCYNKLILKKCPICRKELLKWHSVNHYLLYNLPFFEPTEINRRVVSPTEDIWYTTFVQEYNTGTGPIGATGPRGPTVQEFNEYYNSRVRLGSRVILSSIRSYRTRQTADFIRRISSTGYTGVTGSTGIQGAIWPTVNNVLGIQREFRDFRDLSMD